MLKTDIKPSQQWIVLLGILFFTAEGCVFFLDIFWVLKVILALGIFFYCRAIFFNHILLRGKKALLRLEEQEEDWLLTTSSGKFYGTVLGSSTLTSWVCVLRFQLIGGGVLNQVVFSDSLTPPDYHQLLLKIRR